MSNTESSGKSPDATALWNGLLTEGVLDLTTDLPDITDLPDDPADLRERLESSHCALLRRNVALQNVKERLDSLVSSHDDLLTRSAQWKDALETTADARVAELEQQLNISKADNESLQDRIKDLRFRAEESRRAIMRLQGERKTTGGAGDRRSVTAASLSGWNPSMFAGAAESETGRSVSGSSDDKRAKRSTILFGAASASIAAGNRSSSRHTRTSSGSGGLPVSPHSSAIGIHEATAESELTPRSGGGLRGLRLSSGDDEDASTSESVATLRRPGTAGGLAPPASGSSRPLSVYSQSPTPSSVSAHSGLGSPILEERAFAAPFGVSPGSEEEPLTARPTTPQLAAGGFGAMQLVRQKDDELAKMYADMKAMRIRLDEALEARVASDACLKALKEFIGEGGPEGGEEARAALRGVKLPPLPTDDDDDDGDEGGMDATLKGASAETWTTRWTSLMRKNTTTGANSGTVPPSHPGLPRRGTATGSSVGGSELLSTSPSASSNLSGPSFSAASTDAMTAPTTTQASSPGLAIGGGLATFGSFFARTQGTNATPKAAAPPPPAKSDGQHDGVDMSASANASPERGNERAAPASSSSGPTLNRLSTWFKKGSANSEAPAEGPQGSQPSPSRNPSPLPLNAVASPPFASLEHSTLHKVDLNSLHSSGLAGVDSYSGLGLLPVPAQDSGASPTATDANGMGHLSPSGPPPPPPHKDVQPSARAARVSQRAASVGEDGSLLEEGGPFVPPTFD
ncbi:unnamed protein product [Parajaminaea phylloscopi]